MMAAYNPHKKINLHKTYKQSELNAAGIGDSYYVDEERNKEQQYRRDRLIRQSILHGRRVEQASNGAVKAFREVKSSGISNMDGLTGKIEKECLLDKYGMPGMTFTQIKFLGYNQQNERRKEVNAFMFFHNISRSKNPADSRVECYDKVKRQCPKLEYKNFELRYIVETGGSVVPVEEIPERKKHLNKLKKHINKKLEAEFDCELLKETLEVTYRYINGKYYAHPHLNLIYATEHLSIEQEMRWRDVLYQAANSDEVGSQNYVRDCGVVKNAAAVFRYSTKPFHPEDDTTEHKNILGEHLNNDTQSGARRYGEYKAHETNGDNINVGAELLMHELPDEVFWTAYKALYKTEEGGNQKTGQKHGKFKKFCKFLKDNKLKIVARQNEDGEWEYVPVEIDWKVDPKEAEKNKKEKKIKIKKPKPLYDGSPVNYVVSKGSLIPNAEKGIRTVKMKIYGFDAKANKKHLRSEVEQHRRNALKNNPNFVLDDLADDILTKAEIAEKRKRKTDKEKRDALVKHREMLGEAYLAYTVWIVLYQIHLMFSYKQEKNITHNYCLASLKYYALLPQYDFVDVAIKFIQIHANAPPPCMNKTENIFFNL